jgi:hypothetical protein
MRFFSLTKTNKKEAAEATAPASHHEDKKAKLTPLTAAIVEVHDVEVAGPDVVHGFVSARRSAKCTLWTTRYHPHKDSSLLPLVCLHMSPRSADEFAEAGAALADGLRNRRVVGG